VSLTRRHFLQCSAAFAAGFAGLHRLTGCIAPPDDAVGFRYGPLRPDPENVFELPEGFRYTIFSRVGEEMDDGLLVPGKHDGMAAFPGPDGRTILVRNHENEPHWQHLSAFGPNLERLSKIDRSRLYDAGRGRKPGLGGTTTLVFDTRTQRLERHFLSLAGTTRNCAGGPTPWGTWLTCEEDVTRASGSHEKDHGYVFEVPASPEIALADPIPIKAMGRFYHEAVAIDPLSGIVYLSEDRHDGLLYRYTPRTPGRLLDGGRLQALAIVERPSFDTRNWDSPAVRPGDVLPVEWIDLDDIESPKDDLRDRGFKAGAARFARTEGMWAAPNAIYFCCTNGGVARRGQIWKLTPNTRTDRPEELTLFIEPNDRSVMDMCDNITVAPWGDLVVCEDCGGINRLLGVTPEGEAYTIGRTATASSELAGACFSPDGTTLFVNMQQDGLTLAITGPWRG
jgi:secreted PhoX family phosphatase